MVLYDCGIDLSGHQVSFKDVVSLENFCRVEINSWYKLDVGYILMQSVNVSVKETFLD